jgi:hypothetical protein
MCSGHEMVEGGAKYAQEMLVAAYRDVETHTRILFSNCMFQTSVGRSGETLQPAEETFRNVL